MEWLAATDYGMAREILQRGVALIYLIAFISTLNQFLALAGEHGLLPVPRLLRGRGARGPSLFSRMGYSDRKLSTVCIAGCVMSGVLVLGLPQMGPPWLPLAGFLALWGLYMSIVNVGQIFYGFGWEMLLLEAGFTVGLLGSRQVPPPQTILLLIAWLVFRLEFGAGMIKWRGDQAWRNLTAMYYHHQTQPMPGPFSRLAHLAPRWWHRCEAAGNHGAQLVVPFLLFAPQPIASIAAGIVIATQLWLVATGNFAWLNWITIVLAFCRVSDPVLHRIIPWLPPEGVPPAEAPVWWTVVVLAGTVILAVASIPALRNLFSPHQRMNASFNRWQLGNAYGAFGTVTRERIEVVIEGTEDEAPDEASWREYGFKGKPGDVDRRPRQFAPYHLRLDWMMWFLPFDSIHQRWFHALLSRLLEADARTLALLRHDPFSGRPPRFVRVLTYRYRFATAAEHRSTGAVWVRDRRLLVIGPVLRQ
ncbi:lipase maturation factor family protein [Paeniglutamicibacter sp. ABSL32-1]|uniref:lipase maturation factor family protein n=1 Tax=Paeniglutamicibacter quisquiliarum TaxID=2849498 RepID=UPI001C2D7C88|nr:lipase maturation factor family protein [Paeniglutamicibacter quisquiliarum]MBV1780171.1 lipase maturation factor family protein [Paeniglutamicibacter quisquiliarum]